MSERMPRQISFIIANEGCERFSFYGVRIIVADPPSGLPMPSRSSVTDASSAALADAPSASPHTEASSVHRMWRRATRALRPIAALRARAV